MVARKRGVAAELEALRKRAATCTNCPLFANATQTVFGEGRKRSRVMFVGEQPGDREDTEGHVFVGPAGRELDRGLEAAGIVREDVYLTNVVKHFRFEQQALQIEPFDGVLLHYLDDRCRKILAYVSEPARYARR